MRIDDLTDMVSKDLNLHKTDVKRVIKCTFRVMADRLVEGHSFQWPGVGRFYRSTITAQTGFNKAGGQHGGGFVAHPTKRQTIYTPRFKSYRSFRLRMKEFAQPKQEGETKTE